MTSVSDFVKNNLVLCVCTLGLAIVGYLGYRAIIWVTEKWGNAGRVNEAAQEALRAERAPLDGREEADEPNPLVGRVAVRQVEQQALRRQGDFLDRRETAWPTPLVGGVVVESGIHFSHHRDPIQFPLSLRVNGGFLMYNCRGSRELSQSLNVGGLIYIMECDSLTQLPLELIVGRSLFVSCCPLTTLPTNLRVPESLGLYSCPQLTSLPRGLSVGGNLEICRCENLTALPSDLRVSGHIDLTECTGLTDLPNWITELGYVEGTQEIRNIDLTGTRLPEAVIERLRQVRNPCIRIHFSMTERPTGSNPGLAVDSTFPDLLTAIDFWHQIAVTRESGLPLPELSLSHGASDVCNFLHRLQETREYQEEERRPFLAVRILEVINRMARDVDFCEVTVAEMAAAVVSCGDRVILALDNLDVAYRVRRIEDPLGSEEALRALGRSLLLLAKVDEQAAIKMRTLTVVDEIEVQLAYRLTLADELGLPIATRTMLYRGCAGVSDPEIRDAGAIVLRACTPEAINQFLAEWEPWKKHLRRTEVTAYDSLPVSGAVCPQGAVCPFTLDRPEQAIWYSGNVYEYASFVREFIRSGLDPTNRQPIVWAQVTR